MCETAQPLDRSTCSVCGASFADALRSSARERSHKDPNMAALLSLLFPGAGHAYLGLWGQMVARAVLSGFVAIVFVLTTATRGAPALLSSAFGLSAFGLWVAGAHDAYFEASDESSRVWLKSGAFVYVVLGLLCLLFGAMVVSFFKARASF